MIIRRSTVPAIDKDGRAPAHGPFESLRYSDAGGLTQFGAYVETLQPGSRSSERHWHEKEDELLYVIAGEVTVIEDDGAHVSFVPCRFAASGTSRSGGARAFGAALLGSRGGRRRGMRGKRERSHRREPV